MSSIDTDEFRKLLLAEQARLTGAVDFLEHDNEGTMSDELGEVGAGGTDNHLGDMASEMYDRELDEGLEEGAQQTLVQIDRALARLGDGTYGSCERCGKPIGEERLRARPWATLCIDDQRLADRG